jgi:glycosyltransferase involved in cell wall biosynthesis
VIENGLDLDSIRCYKPKQDVASYVRNGSFRVGFAGRLVPVKRVDLFIQTARYILDNYPDLKFSFHIFGDGPMRDELETLSKKLKTDDIIRFEGHCADIHREIQKLDVLLMTSDHEGLPMILLESMALRTPIIAHAVGGISNLLDHGTCGVLVLEHNARGYAHEIYCLEQSPQTRSDFAQKAYDRVTTNYTAEKNACAYASEYLQILRGKAWKLTH